MAIKQENIMENVKTAMKNILTANNFHTDLGNSVYLNKPNNKIDHSKTEAMNIQDVSLTAITAKAGGVVSHFDYAMVVLFNLLFKGGEKFNKIRGAVYDVLSVIGDNLTWGGLALNSYPPNGEEFIQYVYDQDENIIVGARVFIIIEFRTIQWSEE